MNKLWNVLLYPARLYEKLTDNMGTLVAGIILIGLIDFFLPDIKQIYTDYFTDKPVADIRFNIIMAILVVLLLGVIDVVFFSVPMFDFFKYIKKKEGLPHQVTLIKVIKVYLLSCLIIIPVNFLFNNVFFRNINENSSSLMKSLAVGLFFIIIIWGSAIITRGINTLFSFGPLFRRFTFLFVFTWYNLFSIVFNMKIIYWLLKIFK